MRRAWAWLGMVAAAAAALALHARVPDFEAAPGAERALPQPRFARIVSLGFDALLADYYWLRAVQRVGGTRGDASRHAEELGHLVDLVTTLDPWVGHPYRFAAIWMTDRPESVRHANRLLERGIGFHPADWRNRFYLGFNHFFYLGEHARAAQVLESAIDLEGSPLYLDRLAARLRADSDGLETAARFLTSLSAQSPDERTREHYRDALREIETERRARLLDRARRHYRERTGRDIRRVRDLVEGPDAVLERLPEEPNGAEWTVDAETGRIVSSHYGYRYELRMHPSDRRRQERWGVAEPEEESA